jgi:hypothetical protein
MLSYTHVHSGSHYFLAFLSELFRHLPVHFCRMPLTLDPFCTGWDRQQGSSRTCWTLAGPIPCSIARPAAMPNQGRMMHGPYEVRWLIEPLNP